MHYLKLIILIYAYSPLKPRNQIVVLIINNVINRRNYLLLKLIYLEAYLTVMISRDYAI